jgi:hypothetical protein
MRARTEGVVETDRRTAEAWDAARGWVLFAGMVAALGTIVGAAGWAAGNFQAVGILLGCAVVSAIVAVAMWGVLRWGIEEQSASTVEHGGAVTPQTFRRAA